MRSAAAGHLINLGFLTPTELQTIQQQPQRSLGSAVRCCFRDTELGRNASRDVNKLGRGPLRLTLTSDLLLPFHLVVEVLCLLEEVVHLASLLIPLRGVEHAVLGFPREEFTDVGDGEDNLLHSPVVPHNLQMVGICFQPLHS